VQQPCRFQGNREAIRYWYDFSEIRKKTDRDSLSEYLDGNGFVILWEGGRCLIAVLTELPFPFQLGFQRPIGPIAPLTAIDSMCPAILEISLIVYKPKPTRVRIQYPTR
jgi:hypothetical protein